MKRLWRWIIRGRERRLRRGFEVGRLKDRLAGMSAEDPLWPLLMDMLDAYLVAEAGASVTPGLGDGEAHRFRGRVGMVMDLRSDLEKVWAEAHQQK